MVSLCVWLSLLVISPLEVITLPIIIWMQLVSIYLIYHLTDSIISIWLLFLFHLLCLCLCLCLCYLLLLSKMSFWIQGQPLLICLLICLMHLCLIMLHIAKRLVITILVSSFLVSTCLLLNYLYWLLPFLPLFSRLILTLCLLGILNITCIMTLMINLIVLP
jgi:hypothetical protein